MKSKATSKLGLIAILRYIIMYRLYHLCRHYRSSSPVQSMPSPVNPWLHSHL